MCFAAFYYIFLSLAFTFLVYHYLLVVIISTDTATNCQKKNYFPILFSFLIFSVIFFPWLTFSYGANSCKNVNSGKGFSGYITFKRENVHLSREYSLAFNFYKVFFYINVSLSSLSHLSFSIKRNAFLVFAISESLWNNNYCLLLFLTRGTLPFLTLDIWYNQFQFMFNLKISYRNSRIRELTFKLIIRKDKLNLIWMRL
jgi:hypothetical protein